MDNSMEPIKAGTLLTFTSGAYSDYSIHGVFKAKQDMDPEALRSRYLAEFPDQVIKHRFEEEQFLAWLAKQELIEDIACTEWHLGDYGSSEEMYTTAYQGSNH